MKKPIRSLFDYLILTLLVSVAIILTLYFNGSKYYQQIIIIGLSILYIVWGILHHLKEKTLQARVMLEYVLFGLLGCIIVIGLLK
jgi:predicted membrane channel-forming protein YqfA (hemolysin III family)